MTVKQLQLNLPFEFHDYISEPTEKYFYDYAVIEEGEKTMKLLAVACSRELIDRYMDELGLGRQIKLLNKVFAPKEYALFSEMAKRLGVSKTALSIRLDNLGMIGRNDFSNPYAPIHIDADDFDTA